MPKPNDWDKFVYLAISHYDEDGQPPFVNNLPRAEQHFATLLEARRWLAQTGGGAIERRCSGCGAYERVEAISPEPEPIAA